MSSVRVKQRVASACLCCGQSALEKTPAILMPFVAHRVFGWAPVEIDERWGLRTIKSGTAYTLCTSLFCASCDFLFLDMRFSDEEMARLYRGYRDEEYARLRDHYEPGYLAKNAALLQGAAYIDKVEQFLRPMVSPPISVLDWGGDTGRNTPFRTERRLLHIHDISAVEPVAGARRVGLEEASFTPYDLVVCAHVLEHVAYPLELLDGLRSVMDPKTVLYLELPFEPLMRAERRPEAAAPVKRHWHEHINFFSERALRRLMRQSELDILALSTLRIEEGPEPAYVFQLACRRM